MPEFSSVIFLEVLLRAALTSRESSCPAVAPQSSRIRKDVVLVGVQDRIEIWDKALWENAVRSARKIWMRLQNVWNP